MKHKLWSIWKEGRAWKAQFPKGIMTFKRKRDAIKVVEGFSKTK